MSLFSTRGVKVIEAFFLFIVLQLSAVSAQAVDPTATVPVSFFTNNNDPVPNSNATIHIHSNNCIQIPILANSFSSSVAQAVFAIYKDESCQSYLYSVAELLPNLHGARSLIWTDLDQTQSHIPGETFTDPILSQDGSKDDAKKAHLIQVAIVSTVSGLIFVTLGIYLCYMDNRRNKRRGGFVPEPYSPTGHRNMAEVSGPGRSIYQYNSHYRNTSSTSTNSYLPPYTSEGYYKPPTVGLDSVKAPEEARIATSPSQKQASPISRFDMPTSRSRSFSNLTNQIGTGAGLDPGSVKQGRDAGFGLGYDLEDNKKRDSRRDSDIMMGEAMTTPPHSPGIRPSSTLSDYSDLFASHGGLLHDSTLVHISA
ncbi:hypothetical protein BG011_000078 [Mortierella polycephala]|uniref:Uncharacterized protein n=1 Tax=Mortierella polycephala TaxID=41804 RepID=A0A9P6U7E4_9FUNG|nr:hypothetical protein BG011_000078 [Mortierella polycephala]